MRGISTEGKEVLKECAELYRTVRTDRPREGGGLTHTCRWEMSCPTVISSAIFWYRLWLFNTMLSRMARDR